MSGKDEKKVVSVKGYVHNNSSLSEIKENHSRRGLDLTDDQARMVYDLLYEVEIDIEIGTDTAEIVGIKKNKSQAKRLR